MNSAIQLRSPAGTAGNLQPAPAVPAWLHTVPHGVMKFVLVNNCTLQRAWREFLGVTRRKLAARAGNTQSALSQLEASEKLQLATREKLATGLGISAAQLA